MNLEKKLKVGAIGYGGRSRSYLSNWIRVNRAKVVSLCDWNPEALKAGAEVAGLKPEQCYQDYKEWAKDKETEAVSVVIADQMHAPVSIACMENGKHVAVEKCMSRSLNECQAMIDTARKNNVKLMATHDRRFLRSNATAKHWIEKGRIGPVYGYATICRHYMPGTIGPIGASIWRMPGETVGGGSLMSHGVHLVDLCLWFFGPVEEVSAFWPNETVRGERWIVLILRHRNGVLGTFYSSYMPGRHSEELFQIYGEEGSIEVGSLTTGGRTVTLWQQLYQFGKEPPRMPEPLPQMRMFRGERGRGEGRVAERLVVDTQPNGIFLELEHFTNSILDDTPLIMTGEDGKNAVEVCVAAYLSAAKKRPQSLPLTKNEYDEWDAKYGASFDMERYKKRTMERKPGADLSRV